ncbi:MAG: hypothetical protein N2746_11665 [Deltaproteobacteria bacterium]|nr:hypothetical protein [Deltaproteobacteria bacterium]
MNKVFFVSLIILIVGFNVSAQETNKPAQETDKPAELSKDVKTTETNVVPDKKEETQQPKDLTEKTKGVQLTDNGHKDSKVDFEYKKYSSIGLNISSHSGIGLSYRSHLGSPLLFQISGGVISRGQSYFYTVGAEIQRELSKSKDKRAFGSIAFGIYGEREKKVYEVGYGVEMERSEKWTISNVYSFAVGVGGELAFGSSIIDTLTIGCEIYPVGIYIDESDDSPFNMFPGASLYLYYNF